MEQAQRGGKQRVTARCEAGCGGCVSMLWSEMKGNCRGGALPPYRRIERCQALLFLRFRAAAMTTRFAKMRKSLL